MPKLADTAKQMRAALALVETGQREVQLRGGLVVRLRRNDDRYTLELARTDVQPSDVEVRVCAEAWEVPPGTDCARSGRLVMNPATKRSVKWQLATLTWRERE